ncbi:MAG: hypothetical protein PHP14_00675 [Candidatus Pacebacteria bacterium]|nr:hypothetical protein [Candidatus Paceibacterota bacterium]
MLVLGGANFAFVTLSHFIFSPISVAIWLSKQRLDKNGKLDLSDWRKATEKISIAKESEDKGSKGGKK